MLLIIYEVYLYPGTPDLGVDNAVSSLPGIRKHRRGPRLVPLEASLGSGLDFGEARRQCSTGHHSELMPCLRRTQPEFKFRGTASAHEGALLLGFG